MCHRRSLITRENVFFASILETNQQVAVNYHFIEALFESWYSYFLLYRYNKLGYTLKMYIFTAFHQTQDNIVLKCLPNVFPQQDPHKIFFDELTFQFLEILNYIWPRSATL